MPYELTRVFEFSAAHYLPEAGETHKCRTAHGHNFVIDVTVRGEPDRRAGWVIDFADIRAAVGPVVGELDHHLLNEIPGLENPTAEHIAIWIWRQLKSRLPALSEIRIAETCTAGCIYRGE